MFLKQIAQTIHYYIRKNDLENIINLLIENTKISRISKAVSKLNNILGSNREIYSWKEAKYLKFLKNLDTFENTKVNYELYKTPFKNNNLFLVCLVYYFLNAKDKLKEKGIFDIIELYYLIIIYRKKIDFKSRKKLININNINFNKFDFSVIKKYKQIAFGILTSLFFVGIFFTTKIVNNSSIKANVLTDGVGDISGLLYGSVLFDGVGDIFGYTDVSDLSSFKFLNIIFIFLVVSLIGYLKDVVKSEYIEKVVSFFTGKIFFIFWFFNYLVSLVNNFLIFTLFKIFFSLKYNFTRGLLFLFLMFSFLSYFVFLYLLSFGILFLLGFEINYLYLYVIGFSLGLYYLNFVSGMTNFEKFLITIEGYLGGEVKEN